MPRCLARRTLASVFRKIIVGFKDTQQGQDALELGRVLSRASGASMLVATAPAVDGSGLARLARAEEADLIVLGSSRRGPVGRIFPGATAERVLGEAPCAVAVAPRGYGGDFGASGWHPLSEDAAVSDMRVIGVGYDATPAAERALRLASGLALRNEAALRVLTVARMSAPVPGDSGEGQTAAWHSARELREDQLDAVAALPREARAEAVFLRGFPAEQMVAAAEKGIDLLVLGSRAGGPLRRALHGSVSSNVMRMAPCPVLIAPDSARAVSVEAEAPAGAEAAPALAVPAPVTAEAPGSVPV